MTSLILTIIGLLHFRKFEMFIIYVSLAYAMNKYQFPRITPHA